MPFSIRTVIAALLGVIVAITDPGSGIGIGSPAAAQAGAKSMPWIKVTGGATDISVGANGAVWVVGQNRKSNGNDIWRYSGRNKWQRMPDGALRIAVDPQGNAWVVDKNRKIRRWDGRRWLTVPGGATDIGIGANGTVWVIGGNRKGSDYDIWRYQGGNKWKKIAGFAKRIAVDPKGNAWVVNSKGVVYRYTGKGWWLTSGITATDIGIGAKGHVWVVGTDGAPYAWTGRKWVKYTGGLTNISVDPAGLVWGHNAGGAIWTDKRSASYTKAPRPVVAGKAPKGGSGGSGASTADAGKTQAELRKNPAFGGVSLTNIRNSNGVVTATVRLGGTNANLYAWRAAANKPYISAIVAPELSIRQLLPRLPSANKLRNAKLRDVVVFTVPNHAQNLGQKVSALPAAVAAAVRKTNPAFRESGAELPLAPGMTYVGGLNTSGFLRTATDLMGLRQPVSINGSLALTSYAAPQNTVTFSARFKQDPLALVMKNAPMKVITVANGAKPELFITATGTTDIEVGYRSAFRVFKQNFGGQLSFAKTGAGADAATSIAMELTPPSPWVEPYLLSPQIRVRKISLYKPVITFQRQLDKKGSSDTLSVVTESTKIHATHYKPAAFTFTIDSTSAYPKAAYIDLATRHLTIRQMAELAEVASQMSPQGQIAKYGVRASPINPGKAISALKLDRLPIDRIRIDNPKIYFASAGAELPPYAKNISPPLPEIFGAGIHVRGKLVAFGKTLADSEFQFDFNGIRTDTGFSALPFGAFTLKDPRFKLNAAPAANPRAGFSGSTTIAGIKLASTTVSIGRNNFGYSLQTTCLGAARLSASGSTSGFSFSIPKVKPQFCVPNALDHLNNALAAGQKFASATSQLVRGVGEDTWHGLRDLGNGKINSGVVTNAIKTYGNPANAAAKLADTGKKAAEKISSGVKKLFGKKKKEVRPRYFNTPDDCNKTRDDWSLEYAACWRRGHEMIRLAANPTMCISVRQRIREKGKAIEIWKCEGGWHQQWRTTGYRDVRDGHAPKGKEWCWEGNAKKNRLESRPCATSDPTQKFYRDRHDRLVYNGKCLQVENLHKDGADIFFNTCVFQGGTGKAHPHQKWQFASADAGTTFKRPLAPLPELKPDNKFRTIQAVHTNKCLAAVPANAKNGTRATLQACGSVNAHGSKWRWSDGRLQSQNGKCLGARWHIEAAIVDHVPCNAAAKQWTKIFKTGDKVMIKHRDGSCLGVTGQGVPWLWGCDRNSKYSLFRFR